MRYGSVCSGIEAASVAWEPLGWRADWLAEFEAFPSAVLAHHWPDVPNYGDMLHIQPMLSLQAIPAPDILVGGTPCQSFSVAGLRRGLSDERGNLTLEYVKILDELDQQRAANGFQPRIARNGRGDMGEIFHTLSAEAGTTGKGDASPCVAINSVIGTIAAESFTCGMGGRPEGAAAGHVQVHPETMQVRRLTPTECARLQGFPDDHCLIPGMAMRKIEDDYRNYLKEKMPHLSDDELTRMAKDGPQYKAYGNSMAVPCMRWLGLRIQLHLWGAI